VLCAIFNFGLHPEQAGRWRVTSNPAAAAAKRREAASARLEVFSVEQIEALARAAESGTWRGPHDDLTDAGALLRVEEDAQLGELLRFAAYTGLRRGELVTLRWRDVRWSERVLVVERALSGNVEGTTKGGRVRYIPLGDQALGALDRLSRRPNFTRADDYVFSRSPATASTRQRSADGSSQPATRQASLRCASTTSATPPGRSLRASSIP
jgi:integrase